VEFFPAVGGETLKASSGTPRAFGCRPRFLTNDFITLLLNLAIVFCCCVQPQACRTHTTNACFNVRSVSSRCQELQFCFRLNMRLVGFNTRSRAPGSLVGPSSGSHGRSVLSCVVCRVEVKSSGGAAAAAAESPDDETIMAAVR